PSNHHVLPPQIPSPPAPPHHLNLHIPAHPPRLLHLPRPHQLARPQIRLRKGRQVAQGPSARAHGRLRTRHDSRVGRLRHASQGPPPPHQRAAAAQRRGDDPQEAEGDEVPSVHAHCCEYPRVCEGK